jgi:hypothetical protein
MDTPQNTTLPQTSQVPTTIEKGKLRSQARSLKRSYSELTESRFHGNPLGVDVLGTDLALRSTQLILEATKMHKAAMRANNRKTRDAKRLRKTQT